jgi:hypothetical protein
MSGNAHRLIDHHEVIVVVDDAQIIDRDGLNTHLPARLPRHLKPRVS